VGSLFSAIERTTPYGDTLLSSQNDSELNDPNTVKVVIDKESLALYFSKRAPILCSGEKEGLPL